MTTTIEKPILAHKLENKIKSKKAIVGVIGLGYVGLPTLVHYAKKGHKTIGFDLDERKVINIRQNRSYIKDVSNEQILDLNQQKLIEATTEMNRLSEADVIYVCVPTPIDEYKQPDLKFVESAAQMIADNISYGALVIFESTTYPGTTEEIFVPKLKEKGFEVGKSVFLAYSPERVDPGNPNFDLTNTPKVVGGFTESCTNLAALIIGENAYKVTSLEVAEMSKVYENTFRWINIAFANEMSIIANRMNIDIHEVIKASGTKPYGFMPFYPGPGVGGHCIPVDPYYLTYKAKEFGETTKMIELSGEINDKMPNIVLNRIQNTLNEKGKSIKGSDIVLLGVAYKPNIGDVRESPILPLVKLLEDYGANLTIIDDYVKAFRYKNKNYTTEKLSSETLNIADLTVVATNHTSFDYEWIGKNTETIFDTRNVVDKNVMCEVIYL